MFDIMKYLMECASDKKECVEVSVSQFDDVEDIEELAGKFSNLVIEISNGIDFMTINPISGLKSNSDESIIINLTKEFIELMSR